jgi:hypothetical protein
MNKTLLLMMTASIVYGCALKQNDDEVIIRDPEVGEKVIKIKDISNQNNDDLRQLGIFAGFSADVYSEVGSADRLNKRFPVHWADWKIFCGKKGKPNNPNNVKLPSCHVNEKGGEGLEYEVWTNSQKNPVEAVIVFRGTDFKDQYDWKANLRWFSSSKEDDQYAAVREFTPQLVEKLKGEMGDTVKILTTGHSLGGGLSQQAAYTSESIQLTYAFDPSMVTGFFDVFSMYDYLSFDARKEINIYRVFEHGEILAYARLIMKMAFPLSTTNPKITEIRFNYVKGNVVAQHAIRDLACELLSLE